MDLVYDDIVYSAEEKYVWNVMYATTITEKDIVLSKEELLFSMLNKYKSFYFFTKHPDWQEEKEFRIIIRDRELKDNYIDIDGALEYIIIGTEVEQDKINILYEEIEQFDKKPELFRFEFWDGYYQIVPAIIH